MGKNKKKGGTKKRAAAAELTQVRWALGPAVEAALLGSPRHTPLLTIPCPTPLPPNNPTPPPALQEEAREELLALEAIFGDDLSPAQDGRGLGFALRVLPHPGEAAANYVSLTLVVRWGALVLACGCCWLLLLCLLQPPTDGLPHCILPTTLPLAASPTTTPRPSWACG